MHVILSADIAALAKAAGSELTREQDDLGEVECFRLARVGTSYEFYRHPDAPDPAAVSVLSSKPDDLVALGKLLKALRVKPRQVYTATDNNANPVIDLPRLREMLGTAGSPGSVRNSRSRAATG